MTVTIYTDGGARGNPGPAGIGVVIEQDDGDSSSRFLVKSRRRQSLALTSLLWEHGEYIGLTTNNQAEYRALLCGLEKAKALGATEVRCFLDSELIVKQLNHEYRVRDKDLAPLFVRVWNLAQGFRHATFTHIPRSKNRRADALVNHAIDNFGRI